MLKRRVIACIVVKDGIAVQSIRFRKFLPVGSPAIAAENFNRWGVDEILLQDISATTENRGPDLGLIENVARATLVPLTVAGGISSVADIRNVLKSGADKVAINSAAFEYNTLIADSAGYFGSQCIVASIDVHTEGGLAAYVRSGRQKVSDDPITIAQEFERAGAGELLVNSIHRDGTKLGYDIDLVDRFCSNVEIPVIACGGAGHPAHFFELLSQTQASAAAAANFFHFTEHSVLTTKAYLSTAGIDIRHDTYADYREHPFGEQGRVEKAPEDYLLELVYQYYPEEVI